LRRKRRRSPGLPEVQTFQKAGIKGLVIEPWFGVFVPAAAIVARLNYLLSYANFNGMQIRACRRSTEPAWVAPPAARIAASSSRPKVLFSYANL
jgi:tripartite-type tricarboxylate transporter receptor subunit TctC